MEINSSELGDIEPKSPTSGELISKMPEWNHLVFFVSSSRRLGEATLNSKHSVNGLLQLIEPSKKYSYRLATIPKDVPVWWVNPVWYPLTAI